MTDDRLNHNEPDATEFFAAMDEQCDGFEAAWKAGQTPRIEDFLTGLPGKDTPSRQLLVELVKIDLHYRWSPGPRESDSAHDQAAQLAPHQTRADARH